MKRRKKRVDQMEQIRRLYARLAPEPQQADEMPTPACGRTRHCVMAGGCANCQREGMDYCAQS